MTRGLRAGGMPGDSRTLALSRLPPLTALRVFVVTARHLNFTRAATELHVTPAAVGQQIRLLEEHVGTALFSRHRGELALTAAGQSLAPGLTDAFHLLADTMAQVLGPREETPIRISVPPSFASRWLVPRLDGLRALSPELQVVVAASTHLTDFGSEDVDCVIRYGPGAYPGLAAERLFDEAVIPVCAPDFAALHGLHHGPGRLDGVPLLHEDGPERDASCPDWGTWLRAHGLSPRPGHDGIRLGQSSLVLEAAAAGKGIGLGKLRLAEADLAAGRLIVPFGAPWPVAFSYHFLAPPERMRLPGVIRFSDWLRSQARAEVAAAWSPPAFHAAAE